MARETKPIPFEEFSKNVAGFFERVIHGHETVVVEKDKGELVVVKPAKHAKSTAATRARSSRHKRTEADREADREAFFSSFGGWSDFDDEAFIKKIYESRNMPSRPPVEL